MSRLYGFIDGIGYPFSGRIVRFGLGKDKSKINARMIIEDIRQL